MMTYFSCRQINTLNNIYISCKSGRHQAAGCYSLIVCSYSCTCGRPVTHLSCQTQPGGRCVPTGGCQRWLEVDRWGGQRERRRAAWTKALAPTSNQTKTMRSISSSCCSSWPVTLMMTKAHRPELWNYRKQLFQAREALSRLSSPAAPSLF